MRSRVISAMALYGPKAGPLRDFLSRVQGIIAQSVGGSFRPYSLDQIHATLIILTGVPDPQTGEIVNERHLQRAGVGLRMDLAQAMSILTGHLARPVRVRIGGHRPDQEVPFLSRGQHLYERAFSVQEDAFVLVGWPVPALTGPDRPLDTLRRDMAAANVFHRYHHGDADVDDDLHLVVGHHAGAPAQALDRAVGDVRRFLAACPADLDIGIGDVKVVAADSPTMAPALFVGAVPVDEAALRELMA